MNKNFLYKLELCILQELFFICCLTRGMYIYGLLEYTPWFPYIKKHDTLHSVYISSGNKEGATKTSFSCTDLFFHYINHPVYSAPFLSSQFPVGPVSRTLHYCLVYSYRVSQIKMNHLYLYLYTGIEIIDLV